MKKRNPKNFEKEAVKVSLVSIVGNGALTVFKLLAGILAHSGAMISDAIHSASDIISSIIVIIGVKLSAKESDKSHPYGHERFECVAAIVLAVILLGGLASALGIINLNTGNMTSVGTLLAKGQNFLFTYPHMILFPAIFISLLMLSFNLFGNGLRDAFNPSLRGTEE